MCRRYSYLKFSTMALRSESGNYPVQPQVPYECRRERRKRLVFLLSSRFSGSPLPFRGKTRKRLRCLLTSDLVDFIHHLSQAWGPNRPAVVASNVLCRFHSLPSQPQAPASGIRPKPASVARLPIVSSIESTCGEVIQVVVNGMSNRPVCSLVTTFYKKLTSIVLGCSVACILSRGTGCQLQRYTCNTSPVNRLSAVGWKDMLRSQPARTAPDRDSIDSPKLGGWFHWRALPSDRPVAK